MKLAAIDIGSNAARLLITEVIDHNSSDPKFNKLNLIRVPLRLGFDVFENGLISNEKTTMLVQTLKAFRHLINAYKVDAIKACATSAMRDAKNSDKIIAIIKKEAAKLFLISILLNGDNFLQTIKYLNRNLYF